MKQRIEQAFYRLGERSYDKPWLFILACLALVAFFVYHMQFLILDTTTEGFLKKGDPELVRFEQFKEEFGRDEQFIIALEVEEAFSPQMIAELIMLHEAFEAEVPYIDEVNSLYNVRDIYGEDDELIVDDLLETLPETDADYAALREKVMNHTLYVNSYISSDEKLLNIYLRPDVYFSTVDEEGNTRYELLGDTEIHNIFKTIQRVIAETEISATNVYIAGTPAITEELNIYLVGDMLKFIALALGVIALSLYLLFRRLVSVFMPLLVMITALLSTMGLLSLTGQPIQMPTVILPSFILAVGVGDSIHFLTLFFRHLKFGDDKRTSISKALAHTGLPMFFTSITTAASLCSFGRSEILPVANLGLFAAAGVMFAFIFTIFLLPALLSVITLRASTKTGVSYSHEKKTWFDRFLDFSVNLANNHSVAIVVGGLLLMVASGYSVSKLGFSHDPVKWLPEDSTGRQAIEFVGGKIGGSVPVEIVIDTGEFDAVKDAAFMAKLDDMIAELEAFETETLKVGKVLSVVALLKETNQALFSNDPAAYAIPDNRALIAQEFLMLETSGAEDLFKLVDSNYQKARVTVMTPWVDALHFSDYMAGMRSMLNEKFEGEAKVVITGIVPMLAKTLRQIMNATVLSYMIAFVVISIMMILLLGSVKYGLVSMLPNLLPITMALGLMQINGAPLDMFSMLIGSIAIGLSVDDTVHFMHGFRRAFEKTGNAYQAVSETLHSSGRAMLSTSIVLTCGFLIYLLSVMNNLQDFGFYTALCIVVALLADFWMAPAMVLLMNRKATAKA